MPGVTNKPIMLSVVMLNVVMLNVIMLSVAAPTQMFGKYSQLFENFSIFSLTNFRFETMLTKYSNFYYYKVSNRIGAMTLSITTLSKMTLSIIMNKTRHSA